MSPRFPLDEVAALLRETGAAHQQDFADVDGYDPQWPEWYAQRAARPLAELLGTTIEVEDLAGMLAAADRAHVADPEGGPWPEFYASFLADWLAG